mmetsp:Transcript_24780/g.48450  ORF Transcript_24780/g.48450 Transcript_24780/m.48450 type:complete len:232 (-) Transcript_24780:275-970(-)
MEKAVTFKMTDNTVTKLGWMTPLDAREVPRFRNRKIIASARRAARMSAVFFVLSKSSSAAEQDFTGDGFFGLNFSKIMAAMFPMGWSFRAWILVSALSFMRSLALTQSEMHSTVQPGRASWGTFLLTNCSHRVVLPTSSRMLAFCTLIAFMLCWYCSLHKGMSRARSSRSTTDHIGDRKLSFLDLGLSFRPLASATASPSSSSSSFTYGSSGLVPSKLPFSSSSLTRSGST